jgi:multidrug resistance efflux pump
MIARTQGAPSVEVERANVAQAKAAAERAEVDLELLTVRAPIDGTVLQVNVRAGEFAPAGLVTTPLIVMGNLDPLNVRVDIDEIDVGLFRPEAQAFASLRGQAERRASLTFVRIDPIVVPKKSLTGAATERVDTRVLRVVYALPPDTLPAYSGQQVDVFIAAPQPATAADASK